MSRHTPHALVHAALIAAVIAAAFACGPRVPEGTIRPLKSEGRAGILLLEGTERYTDGEWLKHGAFVFRNDRGEVIAEGHYERGLESGMWQETYDDGSTGRGQYAEGSRTGEWSTFHPRGRRELGGTLQDQGFYDRGLRTGLWISFRPDKTKLREAAYRNGQENGRVVYFEADGRTIDAALSGTYEDGERVGPLDG